MQDGLPPSDENLGSALTDAERAQRTLEASSQSRSRSPKGLLRRFVGRLVRFALEPQSAVNRSLMTASQTTGSSLAGLEGRVEAMAGDLERSVSGIESHLASLTADLERSLAGLSSVTGRLDGSVAGIEGHVTSLTGDFERSLAGLEGHVTTATGDLQGSLAGLEGHVTAVTSELGDSLSGLEDRVTTATGDFDDHVTALTGDLERSLKGIGGRVGEIDERVTELASGLASASALAERITELTDRHLPTMSEDIGAEFAEVRSLIFAQGRQLDEAAGELVATTQDLEDMSDTTESFEKAAALTNERLRALEKRFEPLLSLDHFDFARRYRGDDEVIQKRMRGYAELFGPVEQVLDFGCGRGEFLLECSALGVGSYGVDSDPDMVSHCRLKKVEAIEADALEHLRGVPNRSLDGIFSAQVVEHLTPAEIVELISLAGEKLKRGGKIVIETINPATLAAMHWFYLDPSHAQPVPHEMLHYFLEEANFDVKDVLFSSPVPDEQKIAYAKVETEFEDAAVGELVRLFNENGRRLNDILFGPQDYAIVAER